MTLDMTSFDAALKEHYTSQTIENLVYKDQPFLAMLAKYENFGGRNLPIPLIYGNPQGRSKTFSNALSRSTATESLVEAFALTRAKDYSIATIDNETLKASIGDVNAFMDAATTEIDGAMQSLSNSIARGLFGTVDAYIGQVSAEPAETASTFVVTLSDPEQITNFEVGMMIVIYSAASGGTQRNSDGSDDEWVIAAINRSSGTITLTGTYDSSGTIAASDYIFVEGDRGLGIAGLESWLPSSAPSSAAFFGVNRSIDVVRLGGNRYDGSALPIEEALISGITLSAREGGKIDNFFINYANWASLEKSLGSKVQYVNLNAGSQGQIMFRGIQVAGPRGMCNVIADQNCPSNRAFGLQMDTWKLYSLGKAVNLFDTDGLTMLRQGSADGVEVRASFYGNLASKAPGYSINVQL